MSNETSSGPPAGTLDLYDEFAPPLDDGQYTIDANVTIGSNAPIPAATHHFNVVGPQFGLTSADVAGTFPGRNAAGDFSEALPHIALFRRTLPWERSIGSDVGGPWVALLLVTPSDNLTFESTVHVATDPVLGPLYQNANDPVAPDTICNTISGDAAVIASLLPTQTELSLLSHVRNVNVQNSVLDASSSDGWFAVVVSNRLPAAGASYTAYLVSLEYQSALVTGGAVAGQKATLVVLYSWPFTCAGTGTFDQLFACLDIGMIGKVATSGEPPVADTGHLPMTLHDRAGQSDPVWYRSPLVPSPLTRDPNGPYFTADQCVRLVADTGAEDVTYAAAFEAGRLLAAADPRLAQELMTWRRSVFAARQRGATIATLEQRIPSFADVPLPTMLPSAILQGLAITPLNSIGSTFPIQASDPTGALSVQSLPGLQAGALSAAWSDASAGEIGSLSTSSSAAMTGVNATALEATGRIGDTVSTIGVVASNVGALSSVSGSRTAAITGAVSS